MRNTPGTYYGMLKACATEPKGASLGVLRRIGSSTQGKLRRAALGRRRPRHSVRVADARAPSSHRTASTLREPTARPHRNRPRCIVADTGPLQDFFLEREAVVVVVAAPAGTSVKTSLVGHFEMEPMVAASLSICSTPVYPAPSLRRQRQHGTAGALQHIALGSFSVRAEL